MKKILFFLATVMCAFAITSCKTLVAPEDLTCNPNPLEVKGGKIDATITGNFAEKTFKKKGVIVVTPELRYAGKTLQGAPKTYVGQRVKENGVVIGYKVGGKYEMNVSFPYNPEMKKCELWLTFKATVGTKEVEIDPVKVAEGVIATSTRLTPNKSNAKSGYQQEIDEKIEADIMYLIGQANIRESELKSDDVVALKDALKKLANNDKTSISGVEVAGYASPDGSYEVNTALSEKRQKSAADFLNGQLKAAKQNVEIDSKTTAEDWEGFQEMMEASDMQDKDLVLRVLNMYSDPEEREAQIKNLSTVYGTIAKDVLPKLRRARMLITTTVVGKSDEEIDSIAKNSPDSLSVDELLYAASKADNLNDKEAFLKKAAEKDAQDCRAYNNLASLEIEKGNFDAAKDYSKKALKICPNDPDANYNAAVLALKDGDVENASKYAGKAAGASGDLNDLRGSIAMAKGDYAAAKQAYGKEASNNLAVQQIVTKDYAAARNTLESVKNPDATTYYLLAVVGARTNDKAALCNNLKKAVAMDAQLKEDAANDYEFNAFAEDADFQAIIK